ncbi:peptidase S41 [Granulicella mallensis MP5ACTX8]|uniref:Peptidase S41 n=2 Tax=Granulicella mallensis TaxID=940614 RepID=G8NW16_GRAMM|nr:peptidase S41 [Granulicella mallensis MP5ACTX8]
MLRWSATIGALALLALVGIVESTAHRPSPVHTSVTMSEVKAEDAHLQQMGLALQDGSFLKEHPFQPPWTSHSLLFPSTWAEPGIKSLLHSRHVRADLLLADLDVLQPVMARAYGGWDSAVTLGWNWDRWFGDWRNRLAARGSEEISLDDAFAPMDQLLAFQHDNHTQIPLDRQTSDGSQTALLARAPGSACTEIRSSDRIFSINTNDAGQHVRTAQLWTRGARSFINASYIATPTSYGVPQAVHCGGDWITVQPLGDRRGKPWSSKLKELWKETLGRVRPSVERIGDGIVYARLPEFDSAHYDGVSRQGWANRKPSDHVLIVDLRDNGGGEVDYGLDVLKGWVDQDQMIRFDSIGSQVNSSCLYAALKWSYADDNGNAQMQRWLDRMAQPFPSDCPRSVDRTPSRWTYLQHHFNPKPSDMRIIVLVNSGCGSDCELMTEELASLPQTLVVGANTYGLCQLIQPGYSVLPHTGLHYRMALGRSDPYGDNRSVDGYGLDVDVVLPDVDRLGRESMRELAAIVARP